MDNIINDGESFNFVIPFGQKTTVNINLTYTFVITMKSGTVIEGTATPNAPLTITAFEDIESIKCTFDEGCFAPLHLVK